MKIILTVIKAQEKTPKKSVDKYGCWSNYNPNEELERLKKG